MSTSAAATSTASRQNRQIAASGRKQRRTASTPTSARPKNEAGQEDARTSAPIEEESRLWRPGTAKNLAKQLSMRRQKSKAKILPDPRDVAIQTTHIPQGPSGASTSVEDAAIEASRLRAQTKPRYGPRMQRFLKWWVIDPRTSQWLSCWDITCVFALFFVAIVTPFEIAFLDSPLSPEDIVDRFRTVGWLFIFNRAVDTIFTVDMFLQFRLIYSANSAVEGVRWYDDPYEIVRHYVRGWFFLDLISILVSIFDIIPLFAQGNDVNNVRDLRMLRLMRVFRLIKLIRLLRASRLFRRWETKLAINYSRLAIVRSLVNVALTSHWFACIWGLQVALKESPADTWAESFNYCAAVPGGTVSTAVVPAVDSTFGVAEVTYVCEGGPWALYSASIYWAVMTITSIGYGDIHATDQNISEQVVNTFLMLFGGMLWGNVIGTFCGVIATMNPQAIEFNRRMDDLNRYLSRYDLPADVCRRLREYLHQTKHLQIAAASKEIVSLLSPALQGEVVWLVHKPWLSRVAFFKGAEPEFLVQIALSLAPLVFTPGELAINGFLYIVHRGIALYGGRVLTSGKVWGEDCIIHSTHLQRRWCARAMNYLEVYMISREDVLEIAISFPSTYARIRKAAIRMAVRRQFILAAKLMSAEFAKRQSGSNTFDRILEQATTVPLSELKLQQTLTAHRLNQGPDAAQIRRNVFIEPIDELETKLVDADPVDEDVHTSSSTKDSSGLAATTTASTPLSRLTASPSSGGRGKTKSSLALASAAISGRAGRSPLVRDELDQITSKMLKNAKEMKESGTLKKSGSRVGSDSEAFSALRQEMLDAIGEAREQVVADLGGRIDSLHTLMADLANRLKQKDM